MTGPRPGTGRSDRETLLRIVAVSDSSVYSGAEMVFEAVCLGLARAGHTVLVLVPEEAVRLTEGLDGLVAGRVPAQPTRLAGLQLARPVRLASLARAIRATPGEVLLVNLPSGEYGAGALVVTRRPTVGILHVHAGLRAAGFRLGRLREHVAGVALRRARAVLAVSPVHADLHGAWGYPPSRTSWLPLPTPAKRQGPGRAEARAALGLPPDGPVVAMIGRLSMLQKGQDVLLEAAPELLQRLPGLQLAICGDGPDRQRVAALARRAGIADAVRFTGHTDSATALAAADAIVLPSRFEGLPLVALEALSVGIPGIVTCVDGLKALWPPEWQVPPADPTALARRLVDLLEGPQAARDGLVRNGRERMARLTSDHPHEAVVRALQGVVGS